MDGIMNDNDITHALTRVPGWRRDGNTLIRLIHTENWKSTLLLAGAIGHLVELAWHHPTLTLNYNSVEIRLYTHSEGGITPKDFALAEKINTFIDWQPAREGVLEGTPDAPEHRYLRLGR